MVGSDLGSNSGVPSVTRSPDDEWYLNVWTCDQCHGDFMVSDSKPIFCPYCGSRFERINDLATPKLVKLKHMEGELAEFPEEKPNG